MHYLVISVDIPAVMGIDDPRPDILDDSLDPLGDL
jgi:hypothetical protein